MKRVAASREQSLRSGRSYPTGGAAGKGQVPPGGCVAQPLPLATAREEGAARYPPRSPCGVGSAARLARGRRDGAHQPPGGAQLCCATASGGHGQPSPPAGPPADTSCQNAADPGSPFPQPSFFLHLPRAFAKRTSRREAPYPGAGVSPLLGADLSQVFLYLL